MADHLTFRDMPLDEIDRNDRTYAIRFPFLTEKSEKWHSLTSSIRQVGLLHPPLIQKKRNGLFRIIDGFCRLKSAQFLEFIDLPVAILPAEIDAWQCWKAVVHSRQFGQPMNDVEIGVLLRKIKSGFELTHKELCRQVTSRFGMEISPKFARELIALADLPNPCRELVTRESLPLKTARLFSLFETDDQVRLVRFFDIFRFGRNKIRELLIFIEEICRRDEILVPDLLDQIEKPATEETRSLPQLAESVRKKIHRMRFPILSRHRERFDGFHSSLKLPPWIRLAAAPHFENNYLETRFRFSSRKELEAILKKLEEIRRHPNLEMMLESI
ncbi:MAG: hypothetical protein B6244_07960 [Candidatus Cloacimonetes bacterium 4572_55]|nr:MAG: hypothetical protein B6244_07960 [Candidatus Cloacimonetes bacterium 4572_55]